MCNYSHDINVVPLFFVSKLSLTWVAVHDTLLKWVLYVCEDKRNTSDVLTQKMVEQQKQDVFDVGFRGEKQNQ